MPTPETLKSLIGLLETEPHETKFEFLVDPSGDLVRSISEEYDTNFYMENETLPMDFNDIFEVNRVPSSFHGKIQATLGSIFQDCLLQNIGVEDKYNIDCDIPDAGFDSSNQDGHLSTDTEETHCKVESTSKLNEIECESTDDIKFEHDGFGSWDVLDGNDNNETVEQSDFEYFVKVPNFSESENDITRDESPTRKKFKAYVGDEHGCNINAMTDDLIDDDPMLVDESFESPGVKDEKVEGLMMQHNAWKCRLYRTRRKRKLEKASTELELLETDNKRLRQTHEKMLSNFQKIQQFCIKSNIYPKL